MNVKQFYAEDERRRRSEEITYGSGWRDESDPSAVYTVRWVVETGEVYAMRNPLPPFPVLFDPESGAGMAPLKDTVYAVRILGRVHRREAIETARDGRERHLEDDRGLQWVSERFALSEE